MNAKHLLNDIKSYLKNELYIDKSHHINAYNNSIQVTTNRKSHQRRCYI